MQLLHQKTHFDFIGKWRPALFLSSILNVAVLVGLGLFGLNLGVDFVGGTLIEVKFAQPVAAQEVRLAAETGGLHDPSVQAVGSEEGRPTCCVWEAPPSSPPRPPASPRRRCAPTAR